MCVCVQNVWAGKILLLKSWATVPTWNLKKDHLIFFEMRSNCEGSSQKPAANTAEPPRSFCWSLTCSLHISKIHPSTLSSSSSQISTHPLPRENNSCRKLELSCCESLYVTKLILLWTSLLIWWPHNPTFWLKNGWCHCHTLYNSQTPSPTWSSYLLAVLRIMSEEKVDIH